MSGINGRFVAFLSRPVRAWLAVCAVSAVLAAPAAQARELGIVVGIDRYRFGARTEQPDRLMNLLGAENDARLMARTLRGIGVDLPAERVLIGARATADAFRRTWTEVLSAARPGDGIIVTFAGHGGREREAFAPYDEADGFDETLMFWDFDPSRPSTGRIQDDELFAMLKQASAQRVTFVADACYSGGLTRDMARALGRPRQGGMWELAQESVQMPSQLPVAADDWESLQNVTYLTATADEGKLVREILHGQRPHGALSVAFAAGIAGEADRDGDGYIVRRELQDYVTARVGQMSSRTQTPGFSPRGGIGRSEPVLRPSRAAMGNDARPSPASLPSGAVPLPVSIDGGDLPAGVEGIERVRVAELHFEIRADTVVAFHGNDEIARFARNVPGTNEPDPVPWQYIVDKYRLIEAIDTTYERAHGPVRIAVQCDSDQCDATHRAGERLSIDVHAPIAGGEHLVLFNLPGSVRLEPLYPLAGKNEPSAPAELPFELDLTADAPFGRDDLVAGFCEREPARLRALIAESRVIPEARLFVSLSVRSGCQWGRYALFTGA